MLSFGQSKAVIGLDVGSYAVKAVALQANKDRITLQGYAQARIDKQDLSEVIKGVMNQLGVKGRRLCTSVSGRSVIVRQVETPRLEGPALQQHIAHEADKYIPFGSEEVIIDAQPLPDAEGKKADNLSVMLVAVRRSFVQEHLAQLNLGGVQPETVDSTSSPSPTATRSSARRRRPRPRRRPPPSSTSAPPSRTSPSSSAPACCSPARCTWPATRSPRRSAAPSPPSPTTSTG